RGLCHIVARRLTSAIQDLSDALSFARSRKAGLENEPRILADLANAYKLNGDDATALATVDEAIKVATERHARIPEYLARIVRADLLLRSKTGDQEAEGKQELERARALMQETGARLFESFIVSTGAEHAHTDQISTRAG
ncbi:MAG TPA: hypothetical protein VJ723_03940, partial [Candidatus Angelobacter sp.]|nr:hypothetical protein [Candidatus Angelobacter sp.]